MPSSTPSGPVTPAMTVSLVQQQALAQNFVTSEDSMAIFCRCSMRLTLSILSQMQAFLRANSASLPVGVPPSIPSWAGALVQIQTEIAAETDPNS